MKLSQIWAVVNIIILCIYKDLRYQTPFSQKPEILFAKYEGYLSIPAFFEHFLGMFQ